MDNFKELSPEDIGKLSTEEQVKYFNDLNKSKALKLDALKTELKENSTKELKAAIAELKEDINKSNLEQIATLQKAMEAQGMALNKLLQDGKSVDKRTFETILAEKQEELKSLSSTSNESIKFSIDKATVLTTALH